MKREVQRERKLAAYEIDLGDLEALIQRLLPLFEEEPRVYCRINISLNREELSFNSVQEIREYGALKGRIKKFYLSLSQYTGRMISIRSSGFIRFQSLVSVTGESEAWCAGAIETVVSFLQTRRVWYHWFIAWPFGIFLLVSINIPSLLKMLGYKDVYTNKALVYGWLLIIFVLSILFVSKGNLLPSATLKVTDEEGFLRRRTPELTLIIAIISIFLTIIGWFVGK